MTTPWGEWSVNETRDLIRAKDDAIKVVTAARKALGRAPDGAWDDEFAALQQRYTSAKTLFNAELGALTAAPLTHFVSDNLRTTTTAYKTILAALQNVSALASVVTSGALTGNAGQTMPGSLVDLMGRLANASGVMPTQNTAFIQPVAPDTGTDAIKAADAVLGGVKTGVSIGVPLAIGFGVFFAAKSFSK